MAIIKDGTTLGTAAAVYLNGTPINYGGRVYFNGTEVFRRCYTAGTGTTLYSHSSGYSSVGEGFWRDLESYTVPNCGTFNVSGNYSVVEYPSKTIYIGIWVNDTEVIRLYSIGDGAFHTIAQSYNVNLSSVIEAGDTIKLRAYLWGNFGSDRADGSSMTVKVAS